jgi:phosphatidylserine decarboxylase
MDFARHSSIAREGWPALIVTIAAAFLLYALLGVAGAAPAILLFVWLLYHFRDPKRETPSLPLALVCPLDGRVVAVGAGPDPWLGRNSVYVSLVSGLFDVHSLYSPIEGKLVEQWTEPKHGAADLPRRSHTLAYQIRTDEGDEVVLEIARGRWQGSVRFPYQPGERVGQGRRIGYAALGCKAVIYAADSSRIDIEEGMRTRAASTVMVTLVHHEAVSSLAPPGQE